MSDPFFQTLRRKMGRLLLRGKIRDLWVVRQSLRLEQKCLSTMVATSAKALPQPTSRPLSNSAPLRKIVFIADIMWEANDLVPELEKICPVEVLNLRPALRAAAESGESEPAIVTRTLQGFLTASREREPDVVLFYARGGLLSEEVFALLRSQWSCPLLGMNLDDKVQFLPYGIFSGGDENYRRWAAFFDLNITNSLIASEWYKQSGLSCVYAAQGFHPPDGLCEPNEMHFRYPLSFLGSKKLDREVVINSIRAHGVPVELFGAGWKGGQWVQDTTEIFRNSQINLGIGSATPHFNTIKGRDVECPSVGACYLTTYTWELSHWWEIGKEILCYRNIEEAIEIISYYRRRPEECLAIAQAAFRRAMREHTWEARLRKIFREQLGLN